MRSVPYAAVTGSSVPGGLQFSPLSVCYASLAQDPRFPAVESGADADLAETRTRPRITRVAPWHGPSGFSAGSVA
jgi:hypothetical protein